MWNKSTADQFKQQHDADDSAAIVVCSDNINSRFNTTMIETNNRQSYESREHWACTNISSKPITIGCDITDPYINSADHFPLLGTFSCHISEVVEIDGHNEGELDIFLVRNRAGIMQM